MNVAVTSEKSCYIDRLVEFLLENTSSCKTSSQSVLCYSHANVFLFVPRFSHFQTYSNIAYVEMLFFQQLDSLIVTLYDKFSINFFECTCSLYSTWIVQSSQNQIHVHDMWSTSKSKETAKAEKSEKHISFQNIQRQTRQKLWRNICSWFCSVQSLFFMNCTKELNCINLVKDSRKKLLNKLSLTKLHAVELTTRQYSEWSWSANVLKISWETFTVETSLNWSCSP